MNKIGIDIGRVIISGDTDSPDQFFGPNYLNCPQVKEAFPSITQLVTTFGAEQVFLVSKCGEHTQKRTLEWLNHHDFYKQTGVLPYHVHFCRERHEKAVICKKLGIQIFIDDRFSVLKHLNQAQKLYLFQPSEEEFKSYQETQIVLPIQVVSEWSDLLTKI